MWLEEFVSGTRFSSFSNKPLIKLKLKQEHPKPNFYGGFIVFECFCHTYPTSFFTETVGAASEVMYRWCLPMERRLLAKKQGAGWSSGNLDVSIIQFYRDYIGTI